MQRSSEFSDREQPTEAHPIEIEQVEIRLIRLPLVEPFETSFGSIDSRRIFLVSVQANGLRGWGEVVAAEAPLYSYETVDTAFHVIKDFLAPAMMNGPLGSLPDLARRFAPFRGHNMAKAGLELAFFGPIGPDKTAITVEIARRHKGANSSGRQFGDSKDACTTSRAGSSLSRPRLPAY